jgi:putative CocE/NonD family hydrolase
MSSSVTVERHLSIPMRDGVLLAADLYRPSGSGALPTLLQRTPYNKSGPNGVFQAYALRAAEAGFAVIVQDVRGRFNSSGNFTAFDQEQLDGYDTCEWITGQTWSNGRIGMFGGSYVGLTQWQAVLAGAPGLQAIAPGVTASDYHDGWTYQGGAFNYYFNYSWGTGLATETASRRLAVDPSSTGYGEMILRADGMDTYITQTPLNHDKSLLENAAYYQTWLDHPSLDSYWDGINVAGRYGEIDVATLNMGGWHDIFLGGTLANYLGMHWHGKTERARSTSRLIVGPWSHATFTSGGAVGDYWPGVLSSSDAIDLPGIQLRFFDRWLRDADNGYEKESPVSIFIMGENRWRNEDSWPLERATATELFLGSGGRANTLNGDGALLRDLPSREQSVPDQYLSDPRDPVPTGGGQLCCPMHWSPSGVYDQRKIESRADVLVYTMDPVDEPTEITGPVTLILYAASSALDCDWTAKLVDVCPCGCAYNLTDGILRARYRDSMREPTLLTSGEATRFEVDLWATSVLLAPGHALRLEIASSNFPRFDRNLQTGGDQATTPLCEAIVAHQTVLHDSDHPSRLVVQTVARR